MDPRDETRTGRLPGEETERRNVAAAMSQVFGRAASGDAGDAARSAGADETGGVGPAVPGYRVLRELGRGGQGVVYEAVQLSTQRKVAIKVLLAGMFASERERSRFDREARLVAGLKHPNIVSVYESGVTPDLRPFYVMEYVRGLRLDHYVREKRFSVEETLALMGTICGAVFFANRKGVIHRDLKPSNILVDAQGVPRILDFGLAKTLVGGDSDLSLSREGLGTLWYMSPEQARGDSEELDERTDIYALGVILYELLTGKYPLPVVRDVGEMLRHIKHTPPTPPSRQWSADSGALLRKPSAADTRSGPLRKLARQFTGGRGGGRRRCPIDDEVETIILKTLSKERERRYSTAEELAGDLRRYMVGDTISARRDSIAYRIRKAAARHRRPAAMVAVVVMAVSITAGIAYRNWRMAKRAESESSAAAARARGANRVMPSVESALANWDKAPLAARRARLASALAALDAIIAENPQHGLALLWRARVRTMQGVMAPLSEKPQLVEAAVEDFERAHVASGGFPFAKLATLPPNAGPAGGLPQAVWAAAELRALATPQRAQELIQAAARLTLEDVPLQSGSYEQPYRLAADLVMSHPPSESPREAMATPDRDARVVRIFRRPVWPIDPTKNDTSAPFLMELIYDDVFVVEWTGDAFDCRPNPALFEAATDTDGGLLLTVRSGRLWHGSQSQPEVSAEDVKFTLDLDLNQSGAFKRVDVIAPQVVQIGFQQPAHIAKWALAQPLLPRFVVQDTLAAAGAPTAAVREACVRAALAENPTGCGPYRVAGESTAKEVRLARCADYPSDDANFVREFVCRFVDEPEGGERLTAIESLLSRREVFEAELTTDEFRWGANGASFDKLVKVREPRWNYDYLAWDCGSELLRDPNTRAALACLIDVDAIRVQDFDGLVDAFAGLWGGQRWLRDDGASPAVPHFDPAEGARRLRDLAGWTQEAPGKPWTKAGRELKLRILLPASAAPSIKRVAIRVKQSLESAGIPVELPSTAEPSEPGSAAIDGTFRGVVVNAAPWSDYLRWKSKGRDGVNNPNAYASDQVDELFDKARSEADPADGARMLRQIESIILADQPYLFLWHKPSLWALSPRLRGVAFSARGPVLFYPGPRAWWVPKGP